MTVAVKGYSAVMITLDKKLHGELLKIKSAPAMRLVLYLNDAISETERNLCSFFKKNEKTIRKIAISLEEKDLIKVVRFKDTKEVIYIIHKRFFDVENVCRICPFKGKAKVKVGELEYERLICNKKGKPCYHRHRLAGYVALKFLHSQTEKSHLEVYNRNIKAREYRHVDEWNYKDFASFYAEQFKEYYPNLIPPNTQELRSVVQSIMKVFKEAEKNHWRRLLKQYIIQIMKFYEEQHKVINPFDILNKSGISAFLNSKGRKIKKVQWCDIKWLYCSFSLGDRCSLNKGEKDCTDSIVEIMRRKFN